MGDQAAKILKRRPAPKNDHLWIVIDQAEKAEAIYREEAKNYSKLAFTCIGKKGYEYLKLRNMPVHEYIPDFQKGLTFARVQALSEKLIHSYEVGEFDEIRVIFSEFRSAISQVPRCQTLLPVAVDAQEQQSAAGSIEFLFEPARADILSHLLPRYFVTKMYRALLESAASNYGAQMSAMESATKNAGEMIRKLTLEFNKVRQAGITKELLEIVSGAEALK